jgi:tRNA (cmo5U34)-methyltransferase
MQLEEMAEFFEKRLDGYDEHMLCDIECATEFYPFTAGHLPSGDNVKILDLGCGTGLELEFYFSIVPNASVTAIDLSKGMLDAMLKKFSGKNITAVQGSYFDIPFGNDFNACVSVESLHHFTPDEKLPLYKKICNCLADNGFFILTDYFSLTDEEEEAYRLNLKRLKDETGISDNTLYHYDTPLTVAHETEILLAAGFFKVEILNHWGATYTVKASR